jgi:hypothetical protein
MTESIFTDEDIKKIEADDLTEEKVLSQLEFFKRGAPIVRLNRACTIGDGICFGGSEPHVQGLVQIL